MRLLPVPSWPRGPPPHTKRDPSSPTAALWREPADAAMLAASATASRSDQRRVLGLSSQSISRQWQCKQEGSAGGIPQREREREHGTGFLFEEPNPTGSRPSDLIGLYTKWQRAKRPQPAKRSSREEGGATVFIEERNRTPVDNIVINIIIRHHRLSSRSLFRLSLSSLFCHHHSVCLKPTFLSVSHRPSFSLLSLLLSPLRALASRRHGHKHHHHAHRT